MTSGRNNRWPASVMGYRETATKGDPVRVILGLLVLAAACSSSEKPAARANAELCIAENRPEHLIGVVKRADLTAGTAPIAEPMTLVVADTRIRLPNGDILFKNADGVLLQMYRGDQLLESSRVDFSHYGADKLCLYFRPGEDLTFTEGWKLDVPANTPRCHCWE